MHTIVLVVGIFLIALMFAYYYWEMLKAQKGLDATHEDCDSFEPLLEWRDAHPDEEISSDPYAQALLVRRIEAHQRFLETHPFVHDNGHIEALRSHLKPTT
jgi:hypothetical protein